jgi:hypothetical protein
MIIEGCYHGTGSQEDLWGGLLQRAATPLEANAGSVTLLKLRHYPACLLLYAGGIAAVAGRRYGTLFSLLTQTRVPNARDGRVDSPLLWLAGYRVIDHDLANKVWKQHSVVPVSEHFLKVLREPFRTLLFDDGQYERCFDRFEYLKSLIEVDVTGDVQTLGRYGGRVRFTELDVRKEIAAEEGAVGINWPFYGAGFFSRKRDRFKAAQKRVDDVIDKTRWI